MILGPPRCGKGTIGRVIRLLLGDSNVAGPTLSSLTTQFGLWPLIGKTCAIVSDARLSGRSDLAVITERLLSIIGEDAQTIDRKQLPPVTMRLPTRFVVLTNELPTIPDASGAISTRFIFLRMRESFLGREDTELTAKLAKELPGILLWAIEGWRRLRERGKFVQPFSGEEDVEEMKNLSSPVGQFIREYCDVGALYSVDKSVLFDSWRAWCIRNGGAFGSLAQFGKQLMAAASTISPSQPRVSGKRVPRYFGIRLKPYETMPAMEGVGSAA